MRVPSLSLELDRVRCERGVLARAGGISVVLHDPTVVGVLGPNGCGKTSLLRIVAQLLRPLSGSVGVCGRDVTACDDAPARALVGYAPHEPLLYDALEARRNIELAASLAGVRRRDARRHATTAVARWQLESVADSPAGQLSRGWRQRASLARADVLQPPVMLLDEPTTGLDRDGLALLEQHLRAWRDTRIVLVTSHDEAWLLDNADLLLDLGTAPMPSDAAPTAAPAGVR